MSGCDYLIPIKKAEVQVYNTRTKKAYPSCFLNQDEWEDAKETKKEEMPSHVAEVTEKAAEENGMLDELEEKEEISLKGFRNTPTSAKKLKSKSLERFPSFDASLERISSDISFSSMEELYHSLRENTSFQEELMTDENYAQLIRERMQKPLEGNCRLDAWLACRMKAKMFSATI